MIRKALLFLLVAFVVSCSEDEEDSGSISNPRPLFWADAERRRTFYFDPNAIEQDNKFTAITETADENPRGLALDLVGEKMYWTSFPQGKVHRVNMNGSNLEELVTGQGSPRSIALDVAGGKMYWTDEGDVTNPNRVSKIRRANLDGSNAEDLATSPPGPAAISGIALDVAGGKMYWTRQTVAIYRANLDGSNVEQFIDRSVGDTIPYGIALDLDERKIYWVSRTGVGGENKVRIYQVSMDTKDVKIFDMEDTDDIFENPLGVALDKERGKIYWTDLTSDKIKRANLDGSNPEDYIVSGDVPSTGTGGIRSLDGVALDLR